MDPTNISNLPLENRIFECNCRRVERNDDDLRRRFICTQVSDVDFDGRFVTRFICREIRGVGQTNIY